MAHLIAITCTPGSLPAEVQPEEVKARIQQHFYTVGFLEPQFTLADVLPFLHRVVVAPFPLTLSIASAFMPDARQISIEPVPAAPNTRPVDTASWLQSHNWMSKKCVLREAYNYLADISDNSIVLLIVPSDYYEKVKTANRASSFPEMQWPAIAAVVESAKEREPSQQPVNLRYMDDDLAARLTVKVIKGVEQLMADKRKEIEQSARPVDVTPQITASVSSCLKELQNQLTVKDLPQLQLPAFRLEEDKTVTQQLNAFADMSKKMLAELGKLKESTQHW